MKLKLAANHISKIYGKRKVVDDVSIHVSQGEIVGLLGPNGAGKTTFFYTIVGLIKPSAGEVSLDNIDITSYPMYQRAQNGIGYLAQEASVFRKLSVEDNIRCVLELTKLSKAEQNKKTDSLLEEFSLTAIRKTEVICFQGESDVAQRLLVHWQQILNFYFSMSPLLVLIQWQLRTSKKL